MQANSQTIIVRTSWLYGGNVYGSADGVFKNFVNTMLRISESKSELNVVNDQHGIPTSCVDLSFGIAEIIDHLENRDYAGQIFHFSNSCQEGSVTWADFSRTIFQISLKPISVVNSSSDMYPTKAKRPKWSILKNDSDINLRDWKIGLNRYLAGK